MPGTHKKRLPKESLWIEVVTGFLAPGYPYQSLQSGAKEPEG